MSATGTFRHDFTTVLLRAVIRAMEFVGGTRVFLVRCSVLPFSVCCPMASRASPRTSDVSSASSVALCADFFRAPRLALCPVRAQCDQKNGIFGGAARWRR
jgi:hypothetical protein